MKIKSQICVALLLSVYVNSFSQVVGLGGLSPDASAILDIQSSDKGVLIPRMTTSMIAALSTPAKGLMVYDTVKHQLMVNMGTPCIPSWKAIDARSAWNTFGNTGIDPATEFLGTIDNQPLKFRVNNIQAGELHPSNGNVFWGLRAGISNTSGTHNIAIGRDALTNNTTGDHLIAIGDSALFSVTTCSDTLGKYNIAIGSKSLFSNTCGFRNTAVGFNSMMHNTTGNENTALGSFALVNSVSGNSNTAIGALSLYYNVGGDHNTAIGRAAMYYNTEGSNNTAIGSDALYYNTTGNENTAVGVQALHHSASHYNTGVGYQSLFNQADAQYNTAVGYQAGNSYVLGWNNTLIGANTDVSFNGQYNCVALGEGTTCPDNSTARIGNTATWSIGGYQDWTNISDGRYKRNLRENVVGLDFILRLRPVTYTLDVYRISNDTKERDGREPDIYLKEAMSEKEKSIECGFIAQEVEQAAFESGFDFSGVDKPRTENGLYGLRYATFVVPLVKAVQELSEKNRSLKAQLEQRKAILREVSARIEKLESN